MIDLPVSKIYAYMLLTVQLMNDKLQLLDTIFNDAQLTITIVYLIQRMKLYDLIASMDI